MKTIDTAKFVAVLGEAIDEFEQMGSPDLANRLKECRARLME